MTRLVLCLLLLASLAVTSPAMAVSEQTLTDHFRNWMATKGYDMPAVDLIVLPDDNQDVVVTDSLGQDWTSSGFAVAVSVPGKLIFRQDRTGIHALAARYGGRRGKLSPLAVSGAQVLLHELLHQFGAPEFDTATADDRYYEEAAAESVSRDLLPAALLYLFGHKYREPSTILSNHAEQAKRLRAVSTFGSSTASALGRWNKPPAIAWRKTFVLSDYATRVAMRADAAAKQAAKAWLD